MDTTITRELNEDEFFIFCELQLIPDASELYDAIVDQGGWVLRAIEKRFNALGMTADHKVMIMIMTLGDGVIGKCVKYVDDIAGWSIANKQPKITWKDYCLEIYPKEVPEF